MITHRFKTILGDVPDDWGVAALSTLLDIEACQAGDWGADSGELAVGVIRSTNFTNDGHFDSSDIAQRFFPKEKLESLKLRVNDILIEKSGGSPVQPVGRVLQLERDLDRTWFSNFIQLLRPDPKKINPRFLFWVLHELHCSGIVERLQNQTTQMRNLELRDYFHAKVPIPKPEEQKSISDLLDSVDRKIAHTKELLGIKGSMRRDSMNGPLNMLKTSLLHHLITGKFRTHPCETVR